MLGPCSLLFYDLPEWFRVLLNTWLQTMWQFDLFNSARPTCFLFINMKLVTLKVRHNKWGKGTNLKVIKTLFLGCYFYKYFCFQQYTFKLLVHKKSSHISRPLHKLIWKKNNNNNIKIADQQHIVRNPVIQLYSHWHNPTPPMHPGHWGCKPC